MNPIPHLKKSALDNKYSAEGYRWLKSPVLNPNGNFTTKWAFLSETYDHPLSWNTAQDWTGNQAHDHCESRAYEPQEQSFIQIDSAEDEYYVDTWMRWGPDGRDYPYLIRGMAFALFNFQKAAGNLIVRRYGIKYTLNQGGPGDLLIWRIQY
jgi:hypothetical protein